MQPMLIYSKDSEKPDNLFVIILKIIAQMFQLVCPFWVPTNFSLMNEIFIFLNCFSEHAHKFVVFGSLGENLTNPS